MPISLSGSLNLSGSLTTTGTITATTLVVQTITSSISSITGSTNFGSLSSDTHKFTGSLLVSGSGTFTGSIGTTALNMNNMSALGSISGGSIYLPSTAKINFRSADGTTGYGEITADTSSNLIFKNNVGIGMTPDVNLQVKAISGNNTTFRIGPSASGFELSQDNGGFTVCTIKNIYGEQFIQKYGHKCPIGVMGRKSDNSLYKEKIGWSVSEPLINGMEKTYNWIKKMVEYEK